MERRKQDRKEVFSPCPDDVLSPYGLEVIVDHEQSKLWVRHAVLRTRTQKGVGSGLAPK